MKVKRYTPEEWQKVEWDPKTKIAKNPEDQPAINWFYRVKDDIEKFKKFVQYMGWIWLEDEKSFTEQIKEIYKRHLKLAEEEVLILFQKRAG